jgi:hypothetical protein
MLAEARAADELKQWMIALNAEHYNGGELAQIYDRRMGLLPPEKQGAALAFRERALERLETPLELQLFFSGLLDAPESGAESSEFMAELLASAHRGAVAGVVVKYLAAIEDVRVAAFVWGLLVRGGFTREQLARVQRLMRGSDPAFADLLGKSVDRLIATRHLRQPALKVSYAHPSVREGFEQFLRQNWWKGTDAIEQLCRLLVGMDEADRAWGLETGARILQATGLLARAARQALEFDKRIHAEVDGWLEQSLIDPRAKFAALMHLAAGAGSTRSVPAELARWLLAQTQTFTADDPAVEMPEEPDYDDAWFERVRQHPQAATIAARFIREQLMQESLFVATGFLANLDRIADGLTPAFLDVAEQAAESRALPYLEVVGAGAVRDIVGYERVVDKALDMCARANTLTPEEAVELAAIRDGEDDTPNASAFEEQYAYETHTARGLIAEYVYARRCRGDRQGIASHPRAAELIEFWAWDIASAAQPTSEAEIGALLDAAMGTGDEAAAWDAARRHWSPKLGPRLAQRLRDCKEDGTLRQALATCACANAPELMKLCLQDAAADPAAFVSLLVALHAMSREPELERTDIPPGLLDPWPEAGDIVAAFASADTAPQRVAGTALALLEACSDSVAPSVLAKLVPVLIASDSRPAEAIRRWLAQANTVSDAAAAAKAVVDIADDGLAELALVHARADARSAGLAYLAGRAPVPLPERLLRCADDKSGRVRLALARALAGRPHPDHVRVLARLAHDQWSDGDYMFEEPTRYAVARAAVQTLSAYGVLPAATGNALVSIGFATADRKLGRKALLVAAAQGGPAVQTAIWKRVKDEKLQDGRVAGLVALTKAPAVDAGIVGAFDSAKLLEWPPTLAVTATAFIARHAPVHDAVRIIEDAAHAASHRALLLVGAWQLALRQPTAANGLLGLLPAGHPARQLLDSSIILPENALDQLGEVRIRKSVKQWFKAATSRAFGVPVAPAQEN